MNGTMTLRQKVGQRLVTGFPGKQMSEEFIRLVREYKVGNVILFAENIESCAQLSALCADIQALVRAETGHAAFIAIDQEGGVVSRLAKDGLNIPGAMALAASGDPHSAFLAGEITGRELRKMGVNFNLAPDIDVNSNPENPVIGVRSYGDTPETVSRFGTEMIRGLKAGGVLACAKHFPGHGDTNVDSHLSLPLVDKPMSALEQNELKPFAAAIEAGVPGIMTTHILFPQVEPEKIPATMSRRIITGLLREQMGFGGLVLSDCMEMNAIKEFYGTVEGTLAAVRAGVDLVFISHTASVAKQAAAALEQAAENGALDRAEFDASVARILEAKQPFEAETPPLTGLPYTPEDAAAVGRMFAAAVTEAAVPPAGRPELGGNPLFVGCPEFRATRVSSKPGEQIPFAEGMQKLLGGEACVTSPDPEEAEIAALTVRAPRHTCVVAGTYNGHLHRGQLELVRRLAETGVPVAVVMLRNPYDCVGLPENVYALAVYEYSPRAIAAAADVLSGKVRPTGRLSVRL